MREGYTRQRSPAFTLVELVIVVFVIGLLTAIVVPKFMDGADKACHAQMEANRILLQSAVDAYLQDHGRHIYRWYEDDSELNTWAVARRLVGHTDKTGRRPEKGAKAPYFGPYLDKLPPNPKFGTRDYIGIYVYRGSTDDECAPSEGPLPSGQQWDEHQCGWGMNASGTDPTYEISAVSQ